MTKREAPFKNEEELCASYTAFARESGWVVYPETAGFDLLLVRPDDHPQAGTQIGVEAKQKLNAKVVDQILEQTPGDNRWEIGPDYRVVLVGSIGGAGGLARLLSRIGVTTIQPDEDQWRHPVTQVWPDEGMDFGGKWHVVGGWSETPWTDLTPAHRCELPEFVPSVRAGVPGPVQLTKWKIGALRVMAVLELEGSVTRPRIKQLGCDPTSWTRGPTCWLHAAGKGLYTRTEKLPRFDQQHPEIYAQLLAEQRAKLAEGHDD